MYKVNPNYVLSKNGKRKIFQNEGFEMYCIQIGNIDLPSGQIVACDPFVELVTNPFSKQVTPGKYPVLLNIAHYDNDDERVAYAVIKFNINEVVRWEMATQLGQTLDGLDDDEFVGYGVDSGTGSFMDKQTALSIITYEEENQKDNPDFYIYLELEDRFDENYQDTRSWLVTSIKDKVDNFAIFSTGWGDGVYPSFWGFDENGDPSCLITDFLITE
jgi:hypothetical protein